MEDKGSLCTVDELEATGSKTLTVDEQEICIVKTEAGIFGWINSCPHLGVSLNYFEDRILSMDGKTIQCVNHDAHFEPDTGLCIAGPCVGQSLTPFKIKIEAGKVFAD